MCERFIRPIWSACRPRQSASSGVNSKVPCESRNVLLDFMNRLHYDSSDAAYKEHSFDPMPVQTVLAPPAY